MHIDRSMWSWITKCSNPNSQYYNYLTQTNTTGHEQSFCIMEAWQYLHELLARLKCIMGTLHHVTSYSGVVSCLACLGNLTSFSLFPPPLPPFQSLAATYGTCNPPCPQFKSVLYPVPVPSVRTGTVHMNDATLPGGPGMHATSTNLLKCHKCARACWCRMRCAVVILVNVTILTFEDHWRRECDVVNKRAAAISGVYFLLNSS